MDNIYARDLDGTGSMHSCLKGDPGAVEFAPVPITASVTGLVAQLPDGRYIRTMPAGHTKGESWHSVRGLTQATVYSSYGMSQVQRAYPKAVAMRVTTVTTLEGPHSCLV